MGTVFQYRVAGTPSGPGAESLSSSDIASAMSFRVIHSPSSNNGFVIIGQSNVGAFISVDNGSL